ncbi:hypothetical protein [Dactylosporangium sp. NPDC051541]|uniref:hypothetical protein n=1 Tax=Dactylosporangium sp. NPDC051541 TaxID=3363977 RepID=UPI003794DD3C
MASEQWEYGFVYFVSTQSEEQRKLRNHPDRGQRALEYSLAAVVVDGNSIRSQAVPGKVALLNELGDDGWQVENGMSLGASLPNWLREAVQSAVADSHPGGAVEHYMRRRVHRRPPARALVRRSRQQQHNAVRAPSGSS